MVLLEEEKKKSNKSLEEETKKDEKAVQVLKKYKEHGTTLSVQKADERMLVTP